MKTSAMFEPAKEQIDQLVATHPFALLVSKMNESFSATPLPLLLERDTSGTAILLGHFARANPQVAALQQAPEALVVFQGPHGYISPSWLRDRTQAPTWNFATVHFSVRVELLDDPTAARAAVEKLTAFMETGSTNAWSPIEMGERRERLLPAIVAFRAQVLATNAKFKLGQNERPDVLEDVLIALDRDIGQRDLAAYMRMTNAHRQIQTSKASQSGIQLAASPV